MRIKFDVLVVGLILTCPVSLQAAERVLCEVTNDIDKEVGKMVYELDQDGRSIKHLFKDRYVDNRRVAREELKAADLVGKGIVLHRKDKYVTVRMYSHNFDEQRGGVLYLDTLYNGVSGERKEYAMEIGISPDEVKMIHENTAFNKMHFIAKRHRVLGPIGIERVVFTKNFKRK